MLTHILLFAFLGSIIVVAGTWLARCADQIGDQTPLGRTLAGMILLAVATSLPELSVDCSAARLGAVDLAVGDLFGSSLINLLILGLLDLTTFSRGRMLSRIASAHALSAMMCLVLTTTAALFIKLESPLQFGSVGIGPIAIAAIYLAGLRLVYFDQNLAATEAAMAMEPPSTPAMRLRTAVIGYLIAASCILLTGPFLARTADAIADESGLGGSFVGTTLVAFTTSLPEIVTTLASVRLGNLDMAVGNILGSNSFNMTILLPVDYFSTGSLLASVSMVHLTTALCVILVTCVATMCLLYRAERRWWIIEPDAALVVLLVIGSLYLVYLDK